MTTSWKESLYPDGSEKSGKDFNPVPIRIPEFLREFVQQPSEDWR